MAEIRRKEHETMPAMLRRFTRSVQQSGVLLQARKTRFYLSKLTKLKVRERALRKIKATKERDRLEKLGKLEEERR